MKPHWVKIKTVEIALPSAVLFHTLGKIPEPKHCTNRWETQQNSWWLHIMSLNGQGVGWGVGGKATITKIHSECIYLLRFSSVMFEMGKVINMQTSMNIVMAKSVQYKSLAATVWQSREQQWQQTLPLSWAISSEPSTSTQGACHLQVLGFESNVNGVKIWSTDKKITSLSAVAKPSVSPDGQKEALGCHSQQGASTRAKHLPEALMLALVGELLFLGTAGSFIWVCSVMNSYGGWLSRAVKEPETALDISPCR